VNTLRRALVASLALASVADARSQIANISLSSDGGVVKRTWTKDLERRVAMSEVKENTDRRHEVTVMFKLSIFLVARITDIRITPLGTLGVG